MYQLTGIGEGFVIIEQHMQDQITETPQGERFIFIYKFGFGMGIFQLTNVLKEHGASILCEQAQAEREATAFCLLGLLSGLEDGGSISFV
jgi:hypothetical protein